MKVRSLVACKVFVDASHRGNEWFFSVEDNGIGLAEGSLEKIFGPFERLHSKHEYPGSGLGLCVCKKIVEEHGGKIWAESELGRGTVFYFTLPNK